MSWVPDYIPPPAPAPASNNDAELPAPTPAPRPWLPLNLSPMAALQIAGIVPGVPSIGLPATACSPEDMVDFVGQLIGKTQEAQVRVSREGLKMNQRRLDEHQAKAMKQIETWIKNTEAAERSAGSTNGMKWFMRIAAPVAAVLAVGLTVMTAGAASPLAYMAIAMCVKTLADDASSEAGGPSLGIEDNLTKGVNALLVEARAMSPEDADKYAGLITAALVCWFAPQLVMADPEFAGELVAGVVAAAGTGEKKADIVNGAVTMAVGIAVQAAMCAGGGGAGSSVKAVSAMTKLLAGIGAGTLTAAMGGTKVAKGTIDIETADAKLDAEKARADQKRTNAIAMRQQALFEEDVKTLKEVIAQIDENLQVVGDIMKNAAHTNMQMIANIGRSSV